MGAKVPHPCPDGPKPLPSPPPPPRDPLQQALIQQRVSSRLRHERLDEELRGDDTPEPCPTCQARVKFVELKVEQQDSLGDVVRLQLELDWARFYQVIWFAGGMVVGSTIVAVLFGLIHGFQAQ
jgi:hypothetical protein